MTSKATDKKTDLWFDFNGEGIYTAEEMRESFGDGFVIGDKWTIFEEEEEPIIFRKLNPFESYLTMEIALANVYNGYLEANVLDLPVTFKDLSKALVHDDSNMEKLSYVLEYSGTPHAPATRGGKEEVEYIKLKGEELMALVQILYIREKGGEIVDVLQMENEDGFQGCTILKAKDTYEVLNVALFNHYGSAYFNFGVVPERMAVGQAFFLDWENFYIGPKMTKDGLRLIQLPKIDDDRFSHYTNPQLDWVRDDDEE